LPFHVFKDEDLSQDQRMMGWVRVLSAAGALASAYQRYLRHCEDYVEVTRESIRCRSEHDVLSVVEALLLAARDERSSSPGTTSAPEESE
jgi:hypothetical protein